MVETASDAVEKEAMTESMTVNVAHSADVHGAMTGIVSPSQLATAAAARKSSETDTCEVGDWTQHGTAQLVAFTRVDSHRRAELMDQVDTHGVTYWPLCLC